MISRADNGIRLGCLQAEIGPGGNELQVRLRLKLILVCFWANFGLMQARGLNRFKLVSRQTRV